MPKYWSYKIGQRVWINSRAEYFYPGATGKVGKIIECLEQGVLDYGVESVGGNLYRLKEDEIVIIPDEVGELMKNKIIINGRACAGKDEVADYLVNKYGFTKISFATPIYDIAYRYFNMKDKDRKLLQAIGQQFREIAPDVWVKYAFKKAQQTDKVVVVDCRQANEYKHAIAHGFYPIKVVADHDIRVQRAIKRDGGYPDTSLWENSSETGADNFDYIEIKNNWTLLELHRKIDEIISEGR
jgi:dephospho-CoA kinase